MIGGLAKRYARGLAAVARAEHHLEAVLAELEQVASTLAANPVLANALASPILVAERRNALIHELARTLPLSATSSTLLSLLGDRHRLPELPRIVEALREIADIQAGRIRGTLRIARKIDDTQLAQLREALEKIRQRAVLLTVEVDPSLIGGVSLEMEGRVFDGSASAQLRALAHRLAQGRNAA